MTTLATDTFQRADQSGWGTASDGSTWAIHNLGTDTNSIVSDEGKAGPGYSGQYSTAIIGNKTTGTINHLCRMSINEAGADGVFAGVTFGWQDTTDYYLVGIFEGGLYADKVVGGARSSLAGGNAVSGWSAGSFFWINVTCSTLNTYDCYAWMDGQSQPASPLFSFTDNTWSTGSFGLVWQTFSASTEYVLFDHLTVTDNQTSSPVTPIITWTTRDNQAIWTARDNKAVWTTRDNQITWRTRG